MRLERALAYRFLPRNQAQMPKQSREMATTAKGSGGSQIGTLRISKSKGLTTAATTAAIATPRKIPKARFGCLRQATPHKTRNSRRPAICSNVAMIGIWLKAKVATDRLRLTLAPPGSGDH